ITMRRIVPVILALSAAAFSVRAVELTEDAPSAPAKSGAIRGRIVTSEPISNLRAVSRVTARTYKPDSFDKKKGRFTFENLPGDRRYDVCFQTAAGREIEGINLDFVDERLLRLARLRREQLGLPREKQAYFTKRDAREIIACIDAMKDFMEQRRVLYIRGHGRRATALVELMRTRSFHASKPAEHIWRIELWYFTKNFSDNFRGWVRLANQERLLRRVRSDQATWRKISIEYYPALSVEITREGKSRPIAFILPPAADSSRGRTGATTPWLKTAPHILGLDTTPATAPSTTRRSR
ncbi:MAG: hypothetical protein J7M14_00800, partial [Planctomycetes bacterium]|nr:hypothetical protein [Planctomycetota bacterium]